MVRPIRHDRQWWSGLLESLYGAILGQDAGGYRWDDTDAWTRSRLPVVEPQPLAHLEIWIDLGQPTGIQGSHVLRAATLIWACRYQPDDDGLSQSICQASLDAVMATLLEWPGYDGARIVPQSATIQAVSGAWLAVSLSATLSVPWRA